MRVIAVIAGLAGAGGFAQIPAYSQQYLQRLAGAVDELAVVVGDFDRSAEAAGLSREDALAELAGSAFLEARRADMERTVVRYETLSGDLALLRAAGPYERAALLPARLDAEIAGRAWQDFEPSIPVTAEALSYAGIGFLALYLLSAGGGAAMARRRPAAARGR